MTGIIFFETLRRSWKQILYWGVGIGLYGIFPFLMIPDQDGLDSYAEIVDTLDPALLRAFGIGGDLSFATPEGFIGYSFFSYMLLIFAIFAVIAGLNVSVNEEEGGMMDMLLSLPIPRWTVIMEKLLAYAVMLLGILLVGLGGLFIGNQIASEALQVSNASLVEGMLNIFPGALFILSLTTFMGAIIGRRTIVMAVAGVFVVGSYLIDMIGRAADTQVTDALRQLSIFAHYDGANVLANGIAVGGALGILALAVILSGIATQRFQQRDIAV